MTPAEILAVPLWAPFALFPVDEHERKKLYYELAKMYHPDVCGDNGQMFTHIKALYDACDNPVNVLDFESRDHKHYKLRYMRLHTFELGTMAVCSKIVVFVVDRQHDDLVLNGLRSIGSVRFPVDKLEREQGRYLPVVERTIDTADGRTILIVTKPPETILLRDLIAHMGGSIPEKHVAWIVSELMAFASLHQLISLTHNGLSVDTIFVDPEKHAIHVLGGWWYAKPVGKPMEWLPRTSQAVAPRDMLRSKIADHRIDLECIRSVALTCLGKGPVAEPFAEFLRHPAPTAPIADYTQWELVRKESWGERRFLKLDVTAADVYK